MKVEQGKQAVWQHMKEAGMSEDIALIARYFDIKEVNLFTPGDGGKLTFIDQRMPKQVRIAVATKAETTTKDVIAKAKEVQKRWKK